MSNKLSFFLVKFASFARRVRLLILLLDCSFWSADSIKVAKSVDYVNPRTCNKAIFAWGNLYDQYLRDDHMNVDDK